MPTFPWFQHYPKGVGHSIDQSAYKNIPDMLIQAMRSFPDHVAFENMGKSLTYREVDDYSTAFAAYLQNKAGLKKGDRIALQMPNSLQYPVAMIGAFKAGLVVVNTNPLYTMREMEHQFKDSGATAIIILANFAHNLQNILANTNIETIIVTELGDLLGGVKGHIVNWVIRNIKKMVPSFHLPTAVSLKRVLKEGMELKLTLPEIDLTDLAFLQYTGGTTGVSKGASLSHGNICANVLQCDQWFLDTRKGEEVVVTALPLYHIFALTVNGLLMFTLGAKNVLITNPRDMPGFIKELKKHKMSVFTAVNTLFNGLINHPEFANVDFSRLKYSIGGGMAVQNFVADKWEDITGKPLAEGYGLSETSPLLTCNPLDGSQRKGTIGLPAPDTELAIMDESGNQLPVGESGEICARGPQVMSGYWNRPEETRNAFFHDWFRTGDIGIMDDDGFFKIVDRKKDMILVSGFNVYPNEVEDVIANHDKVLEVAAIGVPDEKSTEAVKVCVVRCDDSLTEDELREYCHENLTGYKRPKYIEFRDELPKSNVGKILRRMLREGS